MRELVVALACFLLTESIPATPPSEPQALVGDDTEAYGSTLTADLTFDNPRSPAGWGSLDFSAAPERDEVRVDVVVGTPAPERRFTCGELNVVIDGVAETVSASELAVPTNDGFFDAVNARMTIDHVRRMVDAGSVRLEVCGEGFDLPRADRVRLREFVRRFDDLAISDGPSLPFPPPELGPRHEWPVRAPVFFGGPPTAT
ncbi:MAG: hypothetical protein H6721_27910 [Sandaracinus sp.]|nr:hypothetical protein [Sandaracinus sp.]MCB9635953.1 hypothetical protein [Sandaracinus sp.]